MRTCCWLLIVLVGCSSLGNQPCSEVDWFELGKIDGADGKRSHHFFAHQAACQGKADRKSYMKGMEQGVADYCRSENAFKLGLSGAAYRNFCPEALEKRFYNRFDLGHQIYRLQVEIEDRKIEIDEYVEQFRFGTSRSSEERQDLQDKINSLQGEQQADQELIKKLFAEAKLSGLIQEIP